MKSKIEELFPLTKIETFTSPIVYVADFTQRTDSARGVEISVDLPKCPKEPEKDMDVMQIANTEAQSLVFATFNDNSFKDEEGNDESHTEGAFFVDAYEDSFFALYEIKDCKLSRISTYKQEIKNKMRCSARVMRKNNIINDVKMVLGLVCFPRKKTSFNDYFNNNPLEMKRIAKNERINFFCSNKFNVTSSSICLPNYE